MKKLARVVIDLHILAALTCIRISHSAASPASGTTSNYSPRMYCSSC